MLFSDRDFPTLQNTAPQTKRGQYKELIRKQEEEERIRQEKIRLAKEEEQRLEEEARQKQIEEEHLALQRALQVINANRIMDFRREEARCILEQRPIPSYISAVLLPKTRAECKTERELQAFLKARKEEKREAACGKRV